MILFKKSNNKSVFIRYTKALSIDLMQNCGFLFLYHSFILQIKIENYIIKSYIYTRSAVIDFSTKNYQSHNR
ncbi:hypothetical protein CHU32_24835 [Superficieibacter electus]|uniref:Uncharacterized protein n=1 Tax=Superficieibacter electus TaxID=2022662 RepID=A0A2P5GI69_9ENTR|nr:hypothetical protein CHU33_22055 [Superficieibacter electus]POP42604.1 hypothetical protein CHU32_24835 [Superficieibacter electus]